MEMFDIRAMVDYDSKLRGLIYNIVTDLSAIDDILQMAYLKAWKGRVSFNGKSSCYTWLCVIARNEAFQYLRKLKQERFYFADLGEHKQDFLESCLGSEQPPCSHLRQYEFLEELNKLSLKAKRILRLRMAGFQVSQISKRLGYSEGSVKSSIHRSKIKLMRLL